MNDLDYEIVTVGARESCGKLILRQVRAALIAFRGWLHRGFRIRAHQERSAFERNCTQPDLAMITVSRCRPCFSIKRYSVVRSTPAMRAALDMLPAVRPTSQL